MIVQQVSNLIQHRFVPGRSSDGIDNRCEITVAPEVFAGGGDDGEVQVRQNFVCHVATGNIKDIGNLRITVKAHQRICPLCAGTGKTGTIVVETGT